jgi:hypothetical protein
MNGNMSTTLEKTSSTVDGLGISKAVHKKPCEQTKIKVQIHYMILITNRVYECHSPTFNRPNFQDDAKNQKKLFTIK